MEGEEQDRHSKALDAELIADPDERARVEARNGLKQFDAVIERIEKSTDSEEIVANIRKAHEIFVDDPPWLFIVHDRNARAMTKNVKGFTSAQSWFQDFTPVYME